MFPEFMLNYCYRNLAAPNQQSESTRLMLTKAWRIMFKAERTESIPGDSYYFLSNLFLIKDNSKSLFIGLLM